MKKRLFALQNDYLVNNVHYEVVPAFKEYSPEIPSEDLADKVKRLVLSEDMGPKKK